MPGMGHERFSDLILGEPPLARDRAAARKLLEELSGLRFSFSDFLLMPS
jgi:hypothetical protein